jgi:hypothetical protein
VLDSDDSRSYALHGLNAIYLGEYGWYRVDACGNKEGVNAGFTPPVERLAYTTELKVKSDLPEIYAEPLRSVVNALSRYGNYEEVRRNLRDISQ